MEEYEAKIWLSRIPYLGSKKVTKLLKKYGNYASISKASKKELQGVEGLSEKMIDTLLDPVYKKNLLLYLRYLEKYKIQVMEYTQKEYPEQLKQIYDPPAFLNIKGDPQVLSAFSLGMVGCRQASAYGTKIAKKLAYELGEKHIPIISGLAKGIDAYSHIGCMEAKETTLAVLGNGLNTVYPLENTRLAERILQTGGCLISEYPLGSPPSRMHFPARNRIISGLSSGIIVVEAKKKSGSMITVEFALEEGKNVFAVPGNIDSALSEGTNSVLQQGAKLITSVEDVLEEYIEGKY